MFIRTRTHLPRSLRTTRVQRYLPQNPLPGSLPARRPISHHQRQHCAGGHFLADGKLTPLILHAIHPVLLTRNILYLGQLEARSQNTRFRLPQRTVVRHIGHYVQRDFNRIDCKIDGTSFPFTFCPAAGLYSRMQPAGRVLT